MNADISDQASELEELLRNDHRLLSIETRRRTFSCVEEAQNSD